MRSLKSKFFSGYTLIEVLVTVAIFALAFVVISAIFIGFNTAQSNANVSQRLLNDGNYVLEQVAREIRMNAIDYNCIDANPATTHTYICLRSLDGKATQFRYTAATNLLASCSGYSTTCTSWQSLTPSGITIMNAAFYSYPTVNPLGAGVDPTQVFQPMTTILMTFQMQKGRAMKTYDLQTTVSSRVYR